MAITGLALFYVYTMQRSNIDITVRKQLELDVVNIQTAISGRFTDVKADLLYIADSVTLKHMLKFNETGDLQSDLETFSRAKKHYDQIRFLDPEGMEVVRVNYGAGNPQIVPRSQLRDKSDRYYFTDTIGLNQGEFFVSPLDLNIENGQIETPIKPTIRFGTAIFSNSGQAVGALVLNYLADSFLSLIPDGFALLNKDGFWLHGGDQDNRWGFMYEGKTTFSQQFPSVWRDIGNKVSGEFNVDGNVFIYNTLYPHAAFTPAADKGLPADAASPPTKSADHYWVLVAPVHNLDRVSSIVQLRQNFTTLLLTMALLYAILSYMSVRFFLNRRLAVKALHERENALALANDRLSSALAHVKQLSGILPICSYCKKIRDRTDKWIQIDSYVRDHSEANFSHGICPECLRSNYPDMADQNLGE